MYICLDSWTYQTCYTLIIFLLNFYLHNQMDIFLSFFFYYQKLYVPSKDYAAITTTCSSPKSPKSPKDKEKEKEREKEKEKDDEEKPAVSPNKSPNTPVRS